MYKNCREELLAVMRAFVIETGENEFSRAEAIAAMRRSGGKYALQYLISTKGDTRNEQYKALALSVSDNMDGKVYAVVKKELDELMKLSNEYFDVRHNDYLNAAKEKREPLNDSQFIEYLYNRAYSILYLLRLKS